MRYRIFALFALLVAALPLRAAVVNDLYEARVEVGNQSPAELKRAARDGLAEVLVKVSGRTDAARQPGLAAALAGADRYLEQYRYEPAPKLQAVLRYDRPQVEQMLRNAGLPVWGDNRPTLLVWLAVDENGSRQLVNEESHADLVAALREQARRRGLLLSFPLLDLDDMAAVTADRVWQLDMSRLGEASARYRVDGLLAGRLAGLPNGRWLGSWKLAAEELRLGFDGEGATLPACLAPGIDRIADGLASRYAVTAEAGDGAVTLWLTGVNGFVDYTRALAYLAQVSQVKSVLPLQVVPGELLLRLDIDGTPTQLERALALDNKLQAEPATAQNPGTAQMRYRWFPSRG